jgi:hypothetical protein
MNLASLLFYITLKQAFISALVLTHYKPGCPLVIETDASDYALAVILSQVESNREIHLVTYLSWTFSDTELNYNMTKNSWQSMKHSRLGNITLKAPKF